MNLLMLSHVYFPRVNGVSTSIRTYAESLAELGHLVTIVAPEYGEGNGEDKYGADGAYETIRPPARGIFFDSEDRLIHASARARPWRSLSNGIGM